MSIQCVMLRLTAAIFLIRPLTVTAQMYNIDDLAVPANRSLQTLYAYYVYSEEDAPENIFGSPYIKFQDVTFDSKNKALQSEEYAYLQLSLMKYRDFWDLINPRRFCCGVEDVRALRCEKEGQLLIQKPVGAKNSDMDVYIHTIPYKSFGAKNKDASVRTTGVYVLILSNCGDDVDARVNGRVTVRNSYGFLPGNEYHKMPFYGWLLVAYIILAFGWMVLSIRWWKELFNIQNCIGTVIIFGFIEALSWYIFFNQWNTNGTRPNALFILALLSSVVKSIFSYMLVLVASLGWGVTRPYLDRDDVYKIAAVCFLYIVLDFIRETVLSFKHSHSISLAFVLLCLLPVSMLNGGIFYWVFTALSNLMETLEERRQTEKLALFQHLWKILIFALTLATITLLVQIFSLSQSMTGRWQYQWLFADGVAHMLFLMVLAAMMYLWAPHKYSQRYAYSDQIDDREMDITNETAPDVWAEDGVADSFWAATLGKDGGPVDVIGAPGAGSTSGSRS